MSDPNYPAGVTDKDIDAIGEGNYLTNEPEVGQDQTVEEIISERDRLKEINREVLGITWQLLGALKRAHHREYPPVWPWELCEKAEKIIIKAKKEMK